MMKIFNRDDWKRSKKIKALHKVLDKLKKKKHELEDELDDEHSGRKVKKLKIKLKTNRRHRQKAEHLIQELE